MPKLLSIESATIKDFTKVFSAEKVVVVAEKVVVVPTQSLDFTAFFRPVR